MRPPVWRAPLKANDLPSAAGNALRRISIYTQEVAPEM